MSGLRAGPPCSEPRFAMPEKGCEQVRRRCRAATARRASSAVPPRWPMRGRPRAASRPRSTSPSRPSLVAPGAAATTGLAPMRGPAADSAHARPTRPAAGRGGDGVVDAGAASGCFRLPHAEPPPMKPDKRDKRPTVTWAARAEPPAAKIRRRRMPPTGRRRRGEVASTFESGCSVSERTERREKK